MLNMGDTFYYLDIVEVTNNLSEDADSDVPLSVSEYTVVAISDDRIISVARNAVCVLDRSTEKVIAVYSTD